MKSFLIYVWFFLAISVGTLFAEENSNSSASESSTYAIKYKGWDGTRDAEIWKISNEGVEELMTSFKFLGGFSASDSYFDVKTGKLFLWQGGTTLVSYEACYEAEGKPSCEYRDLTEEERGFYVYDPSDNTIEKGVKKGFADGYQKTFQGIFALDDLIVEETDGSVHIGEDSLVTIEENGVQQLYATNASDEQININIKKGTDLLIDGVSVAGSINTNATNITTNATNIATNTADITTNATNIATNKTNIAANTAEIATYTDSIAGNTTAIAAIGSDLSAFKASTNSQITYMKSDYSSGIASAVAMSQFNLAQEGFSVGIGQGSYNDENETAFGLGYGGEFKNGTLFKLQASKSGDASGVGLTISF